MSLLLDRLLRLCPGKPTLVRSSLLLSNGFSSSSLQTPPYSILNVFPDTGKMIVSNYANVLRLRCAKIEKKVPEELMREMGTVGSSNGWVASLKDGVVRLQDDLNPNASDTDPKRIPLPPLVTLPHCQTQVVTKVAMSSSSPEDEDCVVAVKFLGPQLSFCSNSEWINIIIDNPCFYSSRVMFSKKHDMFRIPGAGGHIIGSWDPRTHKQKPKFQRLRYQNLPELTKTKRELLHSCCTSEHLVESTTIDETFLVKLYRKATTSDTVKMQTEAVMVFKLDEQGNAVYTEDIGKLCIFISKSEPFCIPSCSFRGVSRNHIEFLDANESVSISLYPYHSFRLSSPRTHVTPYQIPPQNIYS